MTDWTITGADSMRWASERRNHRRVSVEASACMSDGGVASEGECVDLSVGGVLLDSERPAALGQQVTVELHLSAHSCLTTQAEVVRCEGNRIGLRFLRLEPGMLAALLEKTGES
ncbi:MAG: PilZ domain-containing protein [Polyangiaceae bacterium]